MCLFLTTFVSALIYFYSIDFNGGNALSICAFLCVPTVCVSHRLFWPFGEEFFFPMSICEELVRVLTQVWTHPSCQSWQAIISSGGISHPTYTRPLHMCSCRKGNGSVAYDLAILFWQLHGRIVLAGSGSVQIRLSSSLFKKSLKTAPRPLPLWIDQFSLAQCSCTLKGWLTFSQKKQRWANSLHPPHDPGPHCTYLLA